MKNKKGQSLSGLFAGITVITAIALLLVMVLYILSGMTTSFQTAGTTGSAANETVTQAQLTAGAVPLNANVLDNVACNIVYVRNNSVAIGSSNYTLVAPCYIQNLTSKFSTANWNVTYTYTYNLDSSASNSTKTLVTQFITFLPWVGIILLVMAAGVVLFFVIRSFAGGTKGV